MRQVNCKENNIRNVVTAAIAAAIASALFVLIAWGAAPSPNYGISSQYWDYVAVGIRGCAGLMFWSAIFAFYITKRLSSRISNSLAVDDEVCRKTAKDH